MSIQAVGWVLEQTITDAAAKLTLISLANCHNSKTGKCHPSISQMCVETSLSPATVRRKLKALESDGWITRKIHFDNTGRQTANTYIIKFENLYGGGVTMTGGGVNVDRGEGVNCDTPIKEPEEVTGREANASNAREFDEFWMIYPSKVGKPKARTSFTKARKRASFETIQSGLLRYVNKTDDRQWCNPATWLNQDRWEDQYATVQANANSPPRTPDPFKASLIKSIYENEPVNDPQGHNQQGDGAANLPSAVVVDLPAISGGR